MGDPKKLIKNLLETGGFEYDDATAASLMSDFGNDYGRMAKSLLDAGGFESDSETIDSLLLDFDLKGGPTVVKTVDSFGTEQEIDWEKGTTKTIHDPVKVRQEVKRLENEKAKTSTEVMPGVTQTVDFANATVDTEVVDEDRKNNYIETRKAIDAQEAQQEAFLQGRVATGTYQPTPLYWGEETDQNTAQGRMDALFKEYDEAVADVEEGFFGNLWETAKTSVSQILSGASATAAGASAMHEAQRVKEQAEREVKLKKVEELRAKIAESATEEDLPVLNYNDIYQYEASKADTKEQAVRKTNFRLKQYSDRLATIDQQKYNQLSDDEKMVANAVMKGSSDVSLEETTPEFENWLKAYEKSSSQREVVKTNFDKYAGVTEFVGKMVGTYKNQELDDDVIEENILKDLEELRRSNPDWSDEIDEARDIVLDRSITEGGFWSAVATLGFKLMNNFADSANAFGKTLKAGFSYEDNVAALTRGDIDKTLSEDFGRDLRDILVAPASKYTGGFAPKVVEKGGMKLVIDNGQVVSIRNMDDSQIFNPTKEQLKIVESYNPETDGEGETDYDLVSLAYSTGQVITDMLPMIAASALTGGATIPTSIAAMSTMYGSYYNEALQKTGDMKKAALYSAITAPLVSYVETKIGNLEARLGRALSGAEKATIRRAALDTAEEATAKGIRSYVEGRGLITLLKEKTARLRELPDDIRSELLEEYSNFGVEAFSSAAVGMKSEPVTSEEVLETGLITTFASGFMGSVRILADNAKEINEMLAYSALNKDKFYKAGETWIEAAKTEEEKQLRRKDVEAKRVAVEEVSDMNNFINENDIAEDKKDDLFNLALEKGKLLYRMNSSNSERTKASLAEKIKEVEKQINEASKGAAAKPAAGAETVTPETEVIAEETLTESERGFISEEEFNAMIEENLIPNMTYAQLQELPLDAQQQLRASANIGRGIAEGTKPKSTKQKTKEDAIQEQGTAEVPIQPEPEAGEEVGGQVQAGPEVTAGEGEAKAEVPVKAEEEVKTPELPQIATPLTEEEREAVGKGVSVNQFNVIQDAIIPKISGKNKGKSQMDLAIQRGEVTVDQAIAAIESAGLKVPQSISKLKEEAAPKAETAAAPTVTEAAPPPTPEAEPTPEDFNPRRFEGFSLTNSRGSKLAPRTYQKGSDGKWSYTTKQKETIVVEDKAMIQQLEDESQRRVVAEREYNKRTGKKPSFATPLTAEETAALEGGQKVDKVEEIRRATRPRLKGGREIPSLFEQSIESGEITPDDAVAAIESAGIEVPQNILDLQEAALARAEGRPVPKKDMVQQFAITKKDGTKAAPADYKRNPETKKWGRVAADGRTTPVGDSIAQQLDEELARTKRRGVEKKAEKVETKPETTPTKAAPTPKVTEPAPATKAKPTPPPVVEPTPPPPPVAEAAPPPTPTPAKSQLEILKEELAKAGLGAEQAANNVANFLSEAGIEVEITDQKNFSDLAQKRNFSGTADGVFLVEGDTGKIYLNKDKIKGEWGKTIVFHEGIHPVMNIIRNTNPKLYNTILAGIRAEAKRNPEVAAAIAEVEASEEYQAQGKNAIEDETIVEVLARIAAGKIALTEVRPTLKDGLINLFNRIANIFGLKGINKDSSEKQFTDFAMKLSNALNGDGLLSEIVGAENVFNYRNDIPIPGVIYQGQLSQDIVRGSKVDVYSGKETVKLPKKNLKELYEKFNGRVVVINSDSTRVGELTLKSKNPDGTPRTIFMYGGPEYLAIKENVDGNVGFATTQLEAKVKRNWFNYIKELFGEDKGLTLVGVQNPEAVFSNSYTFRYVIDALTTLDEKFLSSEAFKKEFFGEDLIGLKKAFGKDKYEKFLKKYKDINFKNLEAVDEMISEISYAIGGSENSSFVARRAIVNNLLLGIKKQKQKDGSIKVSLKDPKKSKKLISTKLAEIGVTAESVMREISIPEVVDIYMKTGNWGFAISGFEVKENLKKSDIDDVQENGVLHPLFNQKFPGENPFMLDGLYSLNEMFKAIPLSKIDKKTGQPKIYIKNAAMMTASSIYVKGAQKEQKNIFEYKPTEPMLQFSTGIARGKAKLFSTEQARQMLSNAEYTTNLKALEMLGEYPQYLDNVADVIMTQRQKLLDGILSVREVAKSYILTQGSIGSGARALTTLEPDLKKAGLTWDSGKDHISLFSDNGTIRPEELTAWWLGTPEGTKALDDLEKGVVNEKAFKQLEDIRRTFGKNNFRLNSVLGNRKKDRFDFGQKPINKSRFNLANIADLTNKINETKGNAVELEKILTKINGVSEGKKGFIAHMLGLGNMPTVDAVELNFWFTGNGIAKVNKLDKIKAETIKAIRENISALNETVYKEISSRIKTLSETISEKYSNVSIPEPAMQHILHHWIWDRAKKTETTHKGMYQALAQYSTGIQRGQLSSTTPAPAVSFTEAELSEELAKANNISKEQATTLSKVVNNVKSNIAKRLGIPLSEYKRRSAIRVVSDVEVTISDISRSVTTMTGLSSEFINDFTGVTSDFKIAFQESFGKVDPKFIKNNGLKENDYILSAALTLENNGYFDFLGKGVKLSSLKRDAIVQELNSRLTDIHDRAKNTNEFYLQEFSKQWLNGALNRAETEARKDEIQAMIDGDTDILEQQIGNVQSQQRSNLLSSLNYLIPSNDYSPEFKYMVVAMTLKGAQAKSVTIGNKTIEGKAVKRNSTTVGNHQELSSMVLPNVYSEMQNGVSSHPMELIDKHTDKSFISKDETWEIIKDRVFKEQDGGYWVKFEKSNNPSDIKALTLVSKKVAKVMVENPWCTGGGMADTYLPKGDFYLFVDSSMEPQITIRYEGDQIAEVKGTDSGQALSSSQVTIADNILSSIPNGQSYRQQVIASKVYHKLKNNIKPTTKQDFNDFIDSYYIELETYDYDKKEEFTQLKNSKISEYAELSKNLKLFDEVLSVDDFKDMYTDLGMMPKDSANKLLNQKVLVIGTLNNNDIKRLTLPKNLQIKGDLILNDYIRQNFSLPEGLQVDGDLFFSDIILPLDFSLPKNLKVVGSLEFNKVPMPKGFTLPNDLQVGGLSFYRSDISNDFTIPKGIIQVGGSLSFTNMYIPIDFVIPNELNLSVLTFAKSVLPLGFTLPNDLQVNDLSFYGATIQQDFILPNTLKITNDLSFNDAKLPQGFTLPDNLQVGGTLSFSWAPIPKGFTLPDNLQVGGLSFYSSTLPNGFTLPGDLRVGSNVSFAYTKFENGESARDLSIEVQKQDTRGAIIEAPESTLILLDKNNADVTTPIHEIAHEYEKVLTADERKVIEDWSGAKFGTNKFREAFAKGAERYLYEGATFNGKVDKIFENLKKWFSNVIRDAIAYFGDITQLTPEVREVYSKMLIDGYIEPSGRASGNVANPALTENQKEQRKQAKEDLKKALKDFFFGGQNMGIVFDPKVQGQMKADQFKAIVDSLVKYIKAMSESGPYSRSKFMNEMYGGALGYRLDIQEEGATFLFRRAGLLQSVYSRTVERILATERLPGFLKDAVEANAIPKEVVTDEMLTNLTQEIFAEADQIKDEAERALAYEEIFYDLINTFNDKVKVIAGEDIKPVFIYEIRAMKTVAQKLLDLGETQKTSVVLNTLARIASNNGHTLRQIGLNAPDALFIEVFGKNKNKLREEILSKPIPGGDGNKSSKEVFDDMTDGISEGIKEDKEAYDKMKSDIEELVDKIEKLEAENRELKRQKEQAKEEQTTEKISRTKKMADRLFKEYNDLRKQIGLSSGINPKFIEAGMKYTMYLYYSFKGNMIKVRREFFKVKDLKELRPEFNNIVSSLSEEMKEADAIIAKESIAAAVEQLGTQKSAPDSAKMTPAQLIARSLSTKVKKMNEGEKQAKRPTKTLQERLDQNEFDIALLNEVRQDIEAELLVVPDNKRAEMMAKIDDILIKLDNERISLKAKPWVRAAQIRKDIREGAKSLGKTVSELIDEHFDVDKQTQSLAEEFLLRTGLTMEEAKPYLAEIKKQVDKYVEETLRKKVESSYMKSLGYDMEAIQKGIDEVEQQITDLKKDGINTDSDARLLARLENKEKALKKKKIAATKRLEKNIASPSVERMIDALKNHGLNEETVVNAFANSLGIDKIDPKQIEFINTLTRKLRDAQFAVDKEEAAKDLKKYLYRIQKKSVLQTILDIIESYIYANQLSGPPTANTALVTGIRQLAKDLMITFADAMVRDLKNLFVNADGDFTNFRLFVDTMKSAMFDLNTFSGRTALDVWLGKEGISLQEIELNTGTLSSNLATIDKMKALIENIKASDDNAVKKGLQIFAAGALIQQQRLARLLVVSDYVTRSIALPFGAHRALISTALDNLPVEGSIPKYAEIHSKVEEMLRRAEVDEAVRERELIVGEGKLNKKRYRKKIMLDFLPADVQKVARTYADSIAATGDPTGYSGIGYKKLNGFFNGASNSGSEISPYDSNVEATAKFGKRLGISLLKFLTVPFARILFLGAQGVKNATPLGLFQFKLEMGPDGKYKRTGVQLFKDFRYYNSQGNIEEILKADRFQVAARWATATVPTMLLTALFMTLFELEPSDEEENGFVVKLDPDSNYIITTDYDSGVKDWLEGNGITYHPNSVYSKGKDGKYSKVPVFGTYKDDFWGWIFRAAGTVQERLILGKQQKGSETAKYDNVTSTDVANMMIVSTAAFMGEYGLGSAMSKISGIADLFSEDNKKKSFVSSGISEVGKIPSEIASMSFPARAFMGWAQTIKGMAFEENKKKGLSDFNGGIANTLVSSDLIQTEDFDALGTPLPYTSNTYFTMGAIERGLAYGVRGAAKMAGAVTSMLDERFSILNDTSFKIRATDAHKLRVKYPDLSESIYKGRANDIISNNITIVEKPGEAVDVYNIAKNASVLKGEVMMYNYDELNEMGKKELETSFNSINKRANDFAYATHILDKLRQSPKVQEIGLDVDQLEETITTKAKTGYGVMGENMGYYYSRRKLTEALVANGIKIKSDGNIVIVDYAKRYNMFGNVASPEADDEYDPIIDEWDQYEEY